MLAASFPIGRAASAEKVTEVVTFLASDAHLCQRGRPDRGRRPNRAAPSPPTTPHRRRNRGVLTWERRSDRLDRGRLSGRATTHLRGRPSGVSANCDSGQCCAHGRQLSEVEAVDEQLADERDVTR